MGQRRAEVILHQGRIIGRSLGETRPGVVRSPPLAQESPRALRRVGWRQDEGLRDAGLDRERQRGVSLEEEIDDRYLRTVEQVADRRSQQSLLDSRVEHAAVLLGQPDAGQAHLFRQHVRGQTQLDPADPKRLAGQCIGADLRPCRTDLCRPRQQRQGQ